jgi:hypothetical protein
MFPLDLPLIIKSYLRKIIFNINKSNPPFYLIIKFPIYFKLKI